MALFLLGAIMIMAGVACMALTLLVMMIAARRGVEQHRRRDLIAFACFCLFVSGGLIWLGRTIMEKA